MATSPLTDQTTRNDYVATAAQTTFPYTFWIREADHLDVFVNGVLQTITTDYTVTAVQSVTGSDVVFNSGLSLNDEVAIVYNPDIERATDFSTGGSLRASALNLELTYGLSLLQFLKTQVSRTVTFGAATDTAGVSPELPAPSSSRIIGWNSAGDALQNYTPFEAGVSISSIVEDTSPQLGGDLDTNGNDITGDVTFTGVVDVTNINAETSAGGNLRTNGGTDCLSWGGGGSANLTIGGNMSGEDSHKLVNMADPTEEQDYATKAYVDALISELDTSGHGGVDFRNGIQLRWGPVPSTSAGAGTDITFATAFSNGILAVNWMAKSASDTGTGTSNSQFYDNESATGFTAKLGGAGSFSGSYLAIGY